MTPPIVTTSPGSTVRAPIVTAPAQLRLASRRARLVASLLDGLFLVPLSFAIFVAVGEPNYDPEQVRWSFHANAWTMLIGFATFALVQGWTLASRGQTLGKICVGIRIVGENGERVGLGRLLLLRYAVFHFAGLVSIFGGLIDTLMIFRGDHRCLHDHLAGTIVVDA